MKNIIKENFTIITNKLVNDKQLSYGAKGVACYLLSKPENWQFYMKDVEEHGNNGKTQVQKYIKELEKCGFLTRTKLRNEKNQFVGLDYQFNLDYIIDVQVPEEDNSDNSKSRQPEKAADGKHGDIIILNNNNIKEKEIYKEKESTPTLSEVQQYIKEKNYNIDGITFFNYYDINNWRDKNNKTVKNWKLKLFQWEQHNNGNNNNKDNNNEMVNTYGF